jgi:hypothetical protein
LLRPLKPRQRLLQGVIITVVAVGMFLLLVRVIIR